MKNVKLIFFALAFASLGMSSCKKEEVVGSTGPAGPAGNANVKSVSFVTTIADWSGSEWAGWTATFSVPIITSDIVSTGAVMCYMTIGADTYALPYSWFYSSGQTRHVLFTYSTGNVTVKRIDDDFLTNNPEGTTIKVVAITANGLIANPGLDLNDYAAVAEAFDLE